MKLYKRQLLQKITAFINRKEAILIKGTRQVGKTTLLKLLENMLTEKFNINKNNIYFFDLEKLDIREDFNNNPENLLKYINSKTHKQYIFIDEIQYLDNPSNFLKILVDHHAQLKIFATGSSSLEIKRKIQDSLIGRVFYFQLYPLNFIEFLTFQNKKFPQKPTNLQKKQLDSLLKEYLTFGGFPAVVLEQNENTKKEMLKNYINLYISKDIRAITEIKNISSFNNLTKILAKQSGNLLNKNEISNTLNLSFKTVNKYLTILQYTYIIMLLLPFFNNIRSRLTKTSKIYFYDVGIRNALLNDFNDIDFRLDSGALFENFILLELLSKFNAEELYFYRNQQQTEIDFVVELSKLAIEVKYKKYKNIKIFRVFDLFKNFDNKIINLNFNLKLKNYEFIDWWNFIYCLNSANK